jgi:hypothetical protein
MMNRTRTRYACTDHPSTMFAGAAAALAHLLEDHPEVVAYPTTTTDAELAHMHRTAAAGTPELPPAVRPFRHTAASLAALGRVTEGAAR